MSTWRVPESLKEDISKLVPEIFSSTTEAVIELCKIGLQEFSKTKLSDKALVREMYKEEFWVELTDKPKVASLGDLYPSTDWILPVTGYPLAPLQLISAKFVGSVSSAEMDHASVRTLVENKETGTPFPFNWLLHDHDYESLQIKVDPKKADSFSLRVSAHYGYLPPRGSYYAKFRRWV